MGCHLSKLDDVDGLGSPGGKHGSSKTDIRHRNAVSLDIPRRSASGVGGQRQRAHSLINQLTTDERGVRTAKVIRQIPIEARYEIYRDKILGTGMNGAVVLAKHRGTDRICAVKTFSTEGMDAARYRRLYNEVDIFLRMDHPNVCKLLEVYEDESHVYLVMEACMGKDLYERLALQRRYTEEEAAVAAKQMLEAVHYCHTHGVCHRDLKLENWVYAEARLDAPLRLIDFGISQIVSTPKEKMSDTHGTVYYVAPEILKGAYDVRCDVWSIGVIVYMLLSGSPPFAGENPRQTVRNICEAPISFEGPRWKGVSDSAKDFVRELLQKNPADRPSALEASKNDWIRTFVDIQEPQSALIDSDLLEVLCHFAKESDVKRAALSLVAFSINPKDVCDTLADQFRSLDFDESGTIRLGDLTKALTERLGLDAAEAEKIFRKLDQTGDEEIHYSEFLAACLQHRITLTEQDVRDAFCRFDVDNSGVISLSNLRNVLGDRFCGTRVEDLIREADANNEGYITYESFRHALMDSKGEQLVHFR
ncbi:hypothetical protein FOZ60_007884 [Perkinsus olseni]|uniref:non-specific serine/threonine protein kinase n=2 Tax=Perkinsus olseni TaxID=32597 RepID=A0A7J6NKR0_PEROL|nr:hypothetical protein FOZ60_007884 [Perkinsus olseni]